MDQQSREPTLREYFRLLYRRKFTVLVVFVLTAGAVGVSAYLAPPIFTASTTLMFRFGREFIYRSEVAGPDSSRTFSLDEMVNSEVEILGSRDLARQVVDEIGAERLYPDLLAEEPDRETAVAKATLSFQDHLVVTPVFDSSIIRITFEHTDARTAADALSRLVERFKEKHLEVFGDSKSVFLQGQLEKYRERLAGAETALESFKRENGVYQIPEQEKAILNGRSQLQAELRTTVFRIAELEHQLEAFDDDATLPIDAASHPHFSSRRASLMSRRNELGSLLQETEFRISELNQILALRLEAAEDLDLPVPVDPEGGRVRSLDEALIRLLDLELKEKDLLRTHREESRELVTVRAEIALVRSFLEERGGHVERTLRAVTRGELSSLSARREALAGQISAIDSDLRELDARERSLYVATLTGELEVMESRRSSLESELSELERDLAALDSKKTRLLQLEREVTISEQSLQSFVAKFDEARLAEELDERKIVNIRTIEGAATPVAPSGLSKTVKIAVGSAVGLVAGVAVAFFLELLRE